MKKHVKRNIQEWIMGLLSTFSAVGLTGARQVGKITLASMVGASLNKEMLFLTLDDPEVLNAARTDPRGFVAQAKDRILVIDTDRPSGMFYRY
ncbi:AAA domain [Corynebacterium mustelae]|uniref:AAA domain n=1 Tax=Corynebacterium mustelae TaxID=571915 RepID=A0A0G3GZ27_9CORY|nr:AAA family ATPase [Corynebacterium mustelae]AKK04793.1 AAA domain [Corynebacterium mustelae]